MALHWMWRSRSNWNTDILCLKNPSLNVIDCIVLLTCDQKPGDRTSSSLPPNPEGDSSALERSQDHRLRFAEELPLPADPLKHI